MTAIRLFLTFSKLTEPNYIANFAVISRAPQVPKQITVLYNMKYCRIFLVALLSVTSFVSCSQKGDEPKELPPLPDEPSTEAPAPIPGSTDKVVVGYVTSWSSHEVAPEYVTHINYAFGHVQGTFRGVRIDNESRLKSMVALKRQAPHLKILLSIGGWGSGNFSEMAANADNRLAFASDCKRVIGEYGLDGIDIDWEFPTSSSAGISSSPDDTKNFTLLMRDIRAAIGSDKLLTLATVCSADYIDFEDIMPYVNFVNIMAYDMDNPPRHNAPLYQSSAHGGWYNCDKSVKAHIAKGVPADKLVLGMPFYGHGTDIYDNFIDFKNIQIPSGYTACWDNEAMVPYVTDKNGRFVLSYDNARSIGIKCDYIIENELRGAMFWDDAGDDSNHTLHKTIANKLFVESN